MRVKLLLFTFYLNVGLHTFSIGKSSERMSNFWTVWFSKTESEQNFGFPHIPTCSWHPETRHTCFVRVVESPMTIPEVTSETRRRGRGGRRSGRRQGRQRKNEVPGSATADSDAGKKTNLRQAIEQQQHHLAVAAETTTTSLDDRQPPRLPLPTGNQPSAATPVDDNDNESAEDDWEASGNEGSDDTTRSTNGQLTSPLYTDLTNPI